MSLRMSAEEGLATLNLDRRNSRSTLYKIWTHSWFQIVLISLICFCCPGLPSEVHSLTAEQMYNALSGLGGSGQVNQTVAANANVALLSATAATALFVVGPIFDRVGPRVCLLLGGWTYPLYSGSLLCFNATNNGAFVIASGAILGIGASLLWVAQGAIMTTYVPESQKGRAIAAFWVIFNLGGGVGSLASFGLNYDSKTGTVSNATYIALLIIMAVGWSLGLLICPPSYVRSAQLQMTTESEKKWRHIARQSLNTICDWRLTRPMRARVAWAFLFVTGMGIWGGGYAFQKWSDHRLELGLKQDIDYTDGHTSVGPMFLYIFYGAYDAFWQSFCYWLMGARSNSPAVTAVLVGAYKTFQSVGSAMAWRINAMAWRINAMEKPAMTQFAMDWGLCMGSLCIVIPTVLAITLTSEIDPTPDEKGSPKTEDVDGKAEIS
ncbi:uncharacterized protein N7529_010604 [Penicillium soppii]|uniref:uncharacterized protein n=1 Tax=Penicillium soppii TaxID=69789 RepID=UPI00254699DE|nr:uncharacterized protein N7529_010604 [Penicillium soppii]KAJ5856660.1 hypothetical protein N7529_010604 [Penicillium soppii]